MKEIYPQQLEKPPKDEAARMDAAWKEVLTVFFREFIELLFPEIAAEIDWRRGYKFLDTELAQVARGYATGKRVVDKLVQVYLKDGGERWLLLHIEIEASPRKLFNERMYVYNYRLFDRYRVQVVSLGVVIKASSRLALGRYERQQWGCRVLFEFPVLRLSDFAARQQELEQIRNPVAIIVLAQLKATEARKDNSHKLSFKRQLIRMLYGRGYTRAQVLEIFRVIDWVIALPDGLDQQLQREVVEYEEEKVMLISNIEWMAIERGMKKGLQQGQEKGLQQGLQQGREEGREQGREEALFSMISRLLSHKFGKLSQRLLSQLKRLSAPQLEELGEALLAFEQLKDAREWLNTHPPQNGHKPKPKSSAKKKTLRAATA